MWLEARTHLAGSYRNAFTTVLIHLLRRLLLHVVSFNSDCASFVPSANNLGT